MESRQVEKSTGGIQGQYLIKFMDILRELTQELSFFVLFSSLKYVFWHLLYAIFLIIRLIYL